ncbi:ABC transporter substrate-binding protein [Alicyclobacillus kakegawensis]|uniref:ABC transporter substrate-binding protein n=1 Tax=Alicyclobacillus kakegawensis TaxID=392012 RepID=UPI0008368C10|nr:ABC transporter substrate-binding protein [Alicyclobacillus kakegawensis]
MHLKRIIPQRSQFRYWTMGRRKNSLSLLLPLTAVSAALAVTACGASQTTASTAGASSPHQASGQGKVLRFGFITSKGTTPADPIGWAEHTGMLKKYESELGVSGIQFIPFVNGPDLTAAMQGGSVDVGELGDTPAVNARAHGYKSQLIEFLTMDMDVWLVAKHNGPKTVADLKGQTVATSPGSYMSRYLLTLLQQEGISQDVKVVPIYPEDAQAALQSGRIAAYAAPTYTGPQLEKLGFPVIDQASKHNLTGTTVVVGAPHFLASHPHFAEAWVRLTQASLADIKQHPNQYYQFASRANGYPVSIIKESVPISDYATKPFPGDAVRSLTSIEQFLVSQKLITQPFSIRAWETNTTK